MDSISSEIDMSDLQYGGIKGCGTDNFLIEVWNNVLEAIEDKSKAMTIALMSIDFSKAFNGLDHNKCMEKIFSKNASNQTLSMVAAFLEGREMLVRDGLCFSERHQVKGGSPQGTELGNVLFCMAIDDIMHEMEGSSPVSKRVLSPDIAIPDHYLPPVTSTPVIVADEQDSFIKTVNPHGFRGKINIIEDTIPEPPLSRSTYQNVETWAVGYIDDINIGETPSIEDGISLLTTGKEMKTIRAICCECMKELRLMGRTLVCRLIRRRLNIYVSAQPDIARCWRALT